jgi:hypothetical protein
MADLTLRNNKGSALTFDEMDSNFLALDSDLTDIKTGSNEYVTKSTSQTITGSKYFNASTSFDSVVILETLSLGGPGSQFVSWPEDTVKLKFVTEYTSNTIQAGMGHISDELWLASIDSADSTGVRRIGFYLDVPDGGAADAAVQSASTNARVYITLSGMTVKGLLSGDSANFSGKVTANEFHGDGSNLTGVTSYVKADFDSDFGTKSTSDLTEGTNLYYTSSRADSDAKNAISVSGSLSYDPVTGIISYTDVDSDRTVTQIRGLFSAAGDLSYDSSTGKFTNTYVDSERTVAQIRGMFNASGDLSYDSSTGKFSFTESPTYTTSDFDSDFNTKSTSNLSEGANKYYRTVYFDSDLGDKTTDNLAEGSNLYYTTARADSDAKNAISAGGDLSYNPATGVVSYTDSDRTPVQIRGLFSAGGDLSYNSSTGEFTFTERTNDSVRALFSASGDLSYNSSTGQFSYTDSERSVAQIRRMFNAGGDLSYDSTSGQFSYTQRTDSAIRVLISASGDLSYDANTGVMSYTDSARSADQIKGLFSAGGDLSFDPSTGEFSYTDSDRTPAQIRGLFSEGTGVTISSGEISIGQAVDSAANVVFATVQTTGEITAGGNLRVDSDTLFVDASNNRVGIGTTNPAYQVEIENTGSNALLVLDRTDGASTFIEGGSTASVLGSVGANDVKIAYNSIPVVTIGSGGAITVNPDGDGFTFPTADGSANQFLQTDGAGAVTFQSATVSDISDLTATATELNYLDGVTGITLSSANELLVVGGDGSSIVSDNTLAVDTSNNRLGINQTSPEVTLHMTGEGAQTAQIRMEQYNDTADAPDVRTRRYRGTIASPSALQSGDYLFRSNHEYWNGSALIVGGSFAFDNTNNANRTQFAVSVTTDGTSADPNNASKTQFKVDGNDGGAITFNNAYKFPTTDGSSGQVLQTDGSGNLTFQTAASYDSVPVQQQIDSDFTNTRTTDDLTEGSTNLYYTTARADSDAKNAVSATDAGGDGSFSYNSATGVFTYTGPSASEARAHFSGGTGVTITDGVVAIGQSVGTTDNVTFAQTTMDSSIVDGINFNHLTSRHTNTAGTLYFDSDHQKALSLVLDTQNNPNPGVTLNIGQEIVLYVHNLTGAAINKGDAVYISGTAHGKHPQVSLARANVSTTGNPTGLATMDIPDGAHGWVTRYGIVRDVNTGDFAAGSTLYLSADSAGKWTSTEVTVDTGYPFHIGIVLTSDSTAGTILVDGFSEHYEYLRIEDRLKVSGKLEADSASLLNVQFDTTRFDSHQPYSEGLLFYDNKHKTLNYFDDITDMNHEIGVQEHQRVWNNTGSTIKKGQPLYFSGNYTSGIIDVPTVGLADATDVNAYNAQGIAAQDIANNSYGHCLIAGQLTEVNTTGLSDGTNFFVGLGPGLTQNASPTYPNYPMCLGWVVKTGDSDNGILLVNQQNHSVNSFRVRTAAHIGTDLIVDGNLLVNGTQTITSTENVQIGGNIQYLNAGNTIGEAGTTFVGVGLDDAFYAGHSSGDRFCWDNRYI